MSWVGSLKPITTVGRITDMIWYFTDRDMDEIKDRIRAVVDELTLTKATIVAQDKEIASLKQQLEAARGKPSEAYSPDSGTRFSLLEVD
jgi:hypothetical protein